MNTMQPRVCKNCAAATLSDGVYCQQCGAALPSVPKDVRQSNWTPNTKLGAFVAVLIVIWSGVSVRRTHEQTQTNKRDSSTMQTSTSVPTATATPNTWDYSKSDDEMSGKPIHYAQTESLNAVQFDFPYEGIQHATLQIRRHPRYGNHVILSIEKGQFLAGVYGAEVIVRFDDDAPLKFRGNESADHDTTFLFLNGYDRFVSRARKAKMIRISTPVYHEGSPVFEFSPGMLGDF